MSKFINSVFTTDQRGRLSNIVFGKNKYGYFLKIFKPSVNPRTVSQQNIRGFMAAASREWAALTDAQRTAYNNIAGTIEFVKEGLSYTLSGFSLFVKLNRNLQDIGESFYKNISRDTLINPADMNGSTVEVSTTPGTEDITLNIPASLNANTKAMVYATAGLKNSWKPKWTLLRAIGTIDHTFSSGDSIKTMYLAKFEVMPATGDNVGFCVMPVDTTCGLANAKVYMTAVATI